MKKILALLIVISGACHGYEESHLIGGWECEFKSEYIDAQEEFVFDNDSSYKKVTKTFGTKLIDLGKWSLNGNMLHLKREYHVARGEKSRSDQEFQREITKLDKNTLIYKYENTLTTCIK